MPGSNVGRRYAEGVVQRAREDEGFDTWRMELARLEVLLDDDVLRAAFTNPGVSTARRMELAKRLAPELKAETENLLRLLIEHRRTREATSIRQEFDRLADEAQGIVHAALTTAIELSKDELHGYEQALARRLGRQVRLQHQVDPRLVAGATVQIGDRLVDGSVRTQLERLRQQLAG